MKKNIILEQNKVERLVVNVENLKRDGLLSLARENCPPLNTWEWHNKFKGQDKEILMFKRTDGTGYNYLTNENGKLMKYRSTLVSDGKGGQIEEYEPTPLYFESCQVKILPKRPPAINTIQDEAIKTYIRDKKSCIEGVPFNDVSNNYKPKDMNGVNDEVFPDKGIIFVYCKVGLTTIQQDQIENINTQLNKYGWTTTEPLGGEVGPEGIKTARFVFNRIGITDTLLSKALDAINQTRSANGEKELPAYQIKDWKSSESDADFKNLRTDKGAITKELCKNTIKKLYELATGNKGYGVSRTDITTEQQVKLINDAKTCSNQDTRFLGGIFGIQDQLEELKNIGNKWGLGEKCSVRKSKNNPGQYLHWDGVNQRCMECAPGQTWDESMNKCVANESRSNLKSIIRESLIGAKKVKERNVLGESKIVKARLSVVLENVNLKTTKQKDKFYNELLSEMIYLNSQGFDKDIIKEGFWDSLTGLLGHAPTGIMEYFKEYIGKWLVGHLTPVDPEGWIGSMIITGIGNLDIGDISKLTDCNFLTKLISKSVADGAIRKVTHEKGLDGPFYDILRNSLVDMLDESTFAQKLEEGLVSVICPLLGGVKTKMDSATDKLKEKALSAV